MAVKRKTNNSEAKLFAFLAVFITIVGFVIALISKRDDRYVMHYAKQGLVLFVFQLIVAFVSSIAFLNVFLTVPLWIVLIATWIMAWVNALSGQIKETPLISHFAEKIDL